MDNESRNNRLYQFTTGLFLRSELPLLSLFFRLLTTSKKPSYSSLVVVGRLPVGIWCGIVDTVPLTVGMLLGASFGLGLLVGCVVGFSGPLPGALLGLVARSCLAVGALLVTAVWLLPAPTP